MNRTACSMVMRWFNFARPYFLVLLWFCLIPLWTRAAAPSVSLLYPAGAPLNATNSITLSGADKTWPLKAWTPHPQLTFTSLEKAGQMRVAIGSDIPRGPHLVYFMNSNGVSQPRIFMVGSLPEKLEVEPNDAIRQAESITNLPVTLNGKLNKGGDVDTFGLRLQAGQWLTISVDGYSLDSPMDAVIHLKDASGATLAFNHDGINLDPFLAYQARSSATFYVQIAAFAYPPQANVRFTGSDSCVYRLSLTTGPHISHTFPLAVQSGVATSVEIHGWNLPSSLPPSLTLSPPNSPSLLHSIELPDLPADIAYQVPVTAYSQVVEAEPNHIFTNAPMMSLPCGIHGRIEENGDKDRFRFKAGKGDVIIATLASAVHGFPMDAVLQIENAAGKSLSRSDDSNKKPDPNLVWKAPEDGIYAVTVSDLYNKSGPHYIYHLEMSLGRPDFQVSLKENQFVTEPGKVVEIKATVERQHGFTNEIRIMAENLPSGVSMEEVTVPEKNGEVTLKLTAAKNAAPSQQPIRLFGSSQVPGQEKAWQRDVQVPLKGKTTEAGDLLINETDTVWLTIPPPPDSPAPK